MQKGQIIAAAILGLSIAIAGISIGIGFYEGRAGDRFVTVKGLAEREVDANLAIWPITFEVAENNLGVLQNQIERNRNIITSFLTNAGFDSTKISFAAPKIFDTQAKNRPPQARENPFRYVAEATVTTRSNNVDLVKKTMEKSGRLVGKGVVLSAQSWRNPIEFLFTKLNDIKPEMIEQATKNAREAAKKFAKDSGSTLGKIRNASQGYFTIRDRDRNSPDVKKVRVVTTIQYYLVD